MIKMNELDAFNDKKIFIFGSTSFIGKCLIKKLKKIDFKGNIITVSRSSTSSSYNGKIEDKNFVEHVIKKENPYAIINLSAFKERNYCIENFYAAMQTNILGSLNIYSGAVNVSSIKLIINVGTCEEYGNNQLKYDGNIIESPISPYSWSKTASYLMGKIISQAEKFRLITIRPSIAYGPEQKLDMFLPSLINSLLLKQEFDMTDGLQTRDYIFVDDICDAIILALVHGEEKNNLVYNISSGQILKLRDLALKVEELIGNYGLIKFGLKDHRENDIKNYSADNSKAMNELHWKPATSLNEGLLKTIDYYKSVLKIEGKIENTLSFRL
ncbi:NAD-dependent epimerase/dehydratase family protein [Fluviispira vulneris]|uniref:NAD-dependent epimerase/dehydratase family protein n=1 Tax=Fluviispira vulneris TaxID=2763012 RepID=UPI0016490A93|nr:NAD-dependent epimerase/dehydratase family protein [Fluviispira vulneris]